jgi:poly-gamma-glutamate synthesis protein (capsule biosynthesis protein)
MKAHTRILFLCLVIFLLAGYSVMSIVSHGLGTLVSDYLHAESGGVLFVGDVMLARSVEARIHEVGEDHFFDNVRSLQKNSAYVVGNFEASIPEEHARTPDFTFHFSVDPNLLSLLPKAGFTHMTLANNHANDFGSDARENTAGVLRHHDIIPFGNPDGASDMSVTYLRENGKTIALIGLQTVTKEPVLEDISALMKTVRSKSDIQIAVVHWGTEYSLTHTKSQEAFAQFLVQEGVDAIIGHHPHVVEDVGSVNGVPVFYSLGNYVFDQYFDHTVETGLAVKLSVTDSTLTFRLVPVGTEHSVPYIMEDGEAAAFLRDLALRSDERFSTGVSKGLFSVGY